MRPSRNFLAAAVLVALAIAPAVAADAPFLVKPYLQLGATPAADSLSLLWNTDDADADWSVEYRPAADRPFVKAEAPVGRRIAVVGVAPHRLYQVTLEGLVPGGEFTYKVSKGGQEVFAASGPSPKSADQPYRMAIFGDVGANSPDERAVAHRAFLQKPDMVMITGDIVYDRGRVSEYRSNFWPMFNPDEASASVGAPLMRSILFTACPGNHDVAARDLGRFPDGLAYYFTWDQPRNGPTTKVATALAPPLTGPEPNKAAFLDAAGPAYPGLVNFSFDYGNAHWTVLDANPYVDWDDADLRGWVARDLAAHAGATWRFVSFHHPGFNTSREHFEQQEMRGLAPVFEAGKVDVVFNGHVHNYQRSYPLKFAPARKLDMKTRSRIIEGKWTLDKNFDGLDKTRPDGVIYVVTGAGGQHLYNPEQQDDLKSWQEFTNKYVAKSFSLTVADVKGSTLSVQQVAPNGDVIDRFTITKPEPTAARTDR